MDFDFVDPKLPETTAPIRLGIEIADTAWTQACLDPSVDPSHEAIWKAAFVSGFVTGYINVSNAAQRVSERMVAEASQHASTPGGN